MWSEWRPLRALHGTPLTHLRLQSDYMYAMLTTVLILFYICSIHAAELIVTQTGIILMAGGMLREYLTRAVRNCQLVVAVTNSTNPTGILRYAPCTSGFVHELSPQCT